MGKDEIKENGTWDWVPFFSRSQVLLAPMVSARDLAYHFEGEIPSSPHDRQIPELMKPTITEEYRKLQQELHKNPHYGVASLEFAPLVAEIIKGAQIGSVSDYGAGKKNLLNGLQKLGITPTGYFPYDPAFPEYGLPEPADLVCCIDVLEHIEPDLIDNVISDLALITKNLGLFSIHMGAAAKFLADGRNAHLIQKPTSWWLPKLCTYFDIVQLQTHQIMGMGFWVIVRPREIPMSINAQ